MTDESVNETDAGAELDAIDGANGGPTQRVSLQELKEKTPADLLALAESLEIENANSMRKQDMMFAILKELAESGVEISGSGTLEYVEFDPGRRLAWDADRIKANGGWARPRVAYTLEDAGDDGAAGTRVTVEVDAEFGGPIKVLAPLIRRSILRGRTADAARLKELLEHSPAG